MKLYAPITKIDEAQQMVFGYASTEALDAQGEIVKREALEAATDIGPDRAAGERIGPSPVKREREGAAKWEGEGA